MMTMTSPYTSVIPHILHSKCSPCPPQTRRMPNLVRRNQFASPTKIRNVQDDDTQKKDAGRRGVKRRGCRIVAAIFCAVLILAYFRPLSDSLQNLPSLSIGSSSQISREVAPGVRLTVNFSPYKDIAAAAEAEAVVSMGAHGGTLVFEESCDNPRFWLRAEGDALVAVSLSASPNSKNTMSGTFSFPIEGKYELVGYWYGCGQETKEERISIKSVTAVGSRDPMVNATASLFPPSAWIASRKFPQIAPQTTKQPYIWHNPHIPPSDATLLKTESTILSKEGTVGSSGFYSFKSLSNYELVCWLGSRSANLLRKSFLETRPLLFQHQRPFKFHMYPIEYFEKPDRNWEENTKTRLRKCKHILVSVDELKQPVSQNEYVEQVKTFISHLLQVIPDETFPIWMFTVFETPTNATNCLPESLPRTSDHPCNVALKTLFEDSPFPKRVRLLDATEVSLPQLGENKEHLIGAVAMRIYLFVGKQVQEWRSNGQEGTIKGLVRGGTTEPNFKLVPYTGWS